MKKIRYLIPLFVTWLDLFVKHYIRKHIVFGKTFKSLSFLSIYPTKNKGIAFNLFQQDIFNNILKYIIAVFLIILFYEWLKMKNKIHQTACSFIIGGGLANLIERFKYGYVLDFISIDSIFICNIADISICGGLLYIIYLIFRDDIYDQKIK